MKDLKMKGSVKNYESLIKLLESVIIDDDFEGYLIHTRKGVFQIKRLAESIYPSNLK